MIDMSYEEEQLFYACMGFCEAFFHYMAAKDKYNNYRRLTEEDNIEREQVMRMEHKRLLHKFENLKEKMDKVDGERK